VLTGTDQEFYFALQGIDMYAGKWNAAYYNMLKNIYSSKSGSLRVLQLPLLEKRFLSKIHYYLNFRYVLVFN
jgi:hypothetical protein